MALFRKKQTEQTAKKPFVTAAIVAAGNATRMGGIDKQFMEIGGMPVLLRTVLAFAQCPMIDEIVIATKEENIPTVFSMLKAYDVPKIRNIVKGGKTRAESVTAALSASSEETEYFAIHDGARPLVTQKVLLDTLEAAFVHRAAATGVRVKDTIKVVGEDGKILSTPDRNTLWAVHTPQIFEAKAYIEALHIVPNSADFTDDCKLMEEAGVPVYMVEGSYENIKITTPEDRILAEAILEGRTLHD